MRTQLVAGSLAVVFGMGLVACSDDDGGNNTNNLNNNNSVVMCGDGVATGTETCDGADLRINNCSTVPGGFTGGTLACNSFCDGWNTAGCTGGAQCGDSTVEGNEICDLANLDNNDCTTIAGGFTGGTLACNSDCLSWDTTGCNSATCGDNTAEGGELCDGTDHGSDDCTTIGQGFIGGTLDCNGNCDGWITTGCTSPTCGDSTVEGNEICDNANLDSNDCTTVPGNFTGGTLVCGTDCLTWDTTLCTGTGPVCGDGNVDTGEDCDLTNLDSNDCTTVPGGYTGGTLVCNANCTFNVNGCTGGTGFCGDGTVGAGEDCDGLNLGSDDCTTISGGYTGGTLGCNPSCAWNISGCTGGTSTCGNNTVEPGEVCDGNDLNGTDCAAAGPFNGGTLACNANCQLFDISGCTLTNPVCGNGVQEGIEQCDGNDLAGISCLNGGYTGGTIVCDANCQFDLSGCTSAIAGWTCSPDYYGTSDGCDCGCGIVDPDCGGDLTVGACDYCGDFGSCAQGNLCPGFIDPANNVQCTAATATCGDNAAEGGEQCDGADLRSQDCETINLGFAGGTLACGSGCQFDLTGCTAAVCGNNTQEGFEHCDGTDLQTLTCVDVGFVAGTLACDASCQLDTTGCTSPVCGNNAAEGSEECDGTDLRSNDCTTVGGGFGGGTLTCGAGCTFDTTQCTAPSCGDNTTNGTEECDGTDMGPYFGGFANCADWGWTAGTITCDANCNADFSACTGSAAPAGWTCIADYYGDGGCDCGCGVVDVDCGDSTVGSCIYCGEPGACTDFGSSCPGNINSTDNSQCI